MKSLINGVLIAVVLFFSSLAYANAEELKLPTNIAEALASMKSENRTGLVIFTAPWCSYCEEMKKRTILPLFKRLRRKHVVYIMDTTAKPQEAALWKDFTANLPAYAIISADGKRVLKFGCGYQSQESFVNWCDAPINP